MTNKEAWERYRNPPTMNELKYLRIHKYIEYNCLPTATYMVVRDEQAEELMAILKLLGCKQMFRRDRLMLPTKNPHPLNDIAMYKDTGNKWILPSGGLKLLGIID